MAATNRVNCCSEEEPMYLELWVSSSEPIVPRVGSIWLLTRGKFPAAVSVASTRFSLSGVDHVAGTGVEEGAEALGGGLGSSIGNGVGQRERVAPPGGGAGEGDAGTGLLPQVHLVLRAPLGENRDGDRVVGGKKRRPAHRRAQIEV